MELKAVSQSTALFLKIAPSARAWGMGRSYVALADDIGSAYFNPAGLSNVKNDEFIFMYAPWLKQFVDDLHFSYLAWGREWKDFGNVAAQLTFLSLGEQIQTSPDNVTMGTFSSYEMALAFSYGTYISENIAVGGSFKYIHSHLSDQGAGNEKGSGVGKSFALDFGILYYTPFLPKLTLAASITNIGPDMSYIDADQADPLPRSMKLGFAYRFIDDEFSKLNWIGDADIDLITLEDQLVGNENEKMTTETIYSTGLEYWYGKSIALRAGYYLDEDGDVKSPTFGASILWERFQFDFGYFKGDKGEPLENQLLFSLLFKL